MSLSDGHRLSRVSGHAFLFCVNTAKSAPIMFLWEVLLERYLRKYYLEGDLEILSHNTHIEAKR